MMKEELTPENLREIVKYLTKKTDDGKLVKAPCTVCALIYVRPYISCTGCKFYKITNTSFLCSYHKYGKGLR